MTQPSHHAAGEVPGQYPLDREPTPPRWVPKPGPPVTAEQADRADRRFGFVLESIVGALFLFVIGTVGHLLTGRWFNGSSGWTSLVVIAVISGPLMASAERWGTRRARTRKDLKAGPN